MGDNVKSLQFIDGSLSCFERISSDELALFYTCIPNLRVICFGLFLHDCWYLENFSKVDKDSFKRLQEIKIKKNYLARPGKILFYKINLNYSNTITHLKIDSYYEGLFETGDGQNNLIVYLSKFVHLTHLAIQIFSTDISSTVIINQLNMRMHC